MTRAALFALFAASGFAGLVYESIWSHYLKLFLGHAAYAQTLVLAIFMGGMALGAWLCSRHSDRWRNLLLGYAVIEAAIGLCALAFHRVFVGVTEFAYDNVMWSLGSPLLASVFSWSLAAALILPQSVLLGMTFPLMSGGLIRAQPDRSGSTIAMLYFTNSLGAAVGVLVSGFALVAWVGLPGTMLSAGLLNILVALAVWLLARQAAAPRPLGPPAAAGAPVPRGYAWMLAIAGLTGTASFIYEIGWIRMLSLVLGSSTHAFELMLAAFIFGLAFGGLWIRRRIERIAEPERFLGLVQVAMGLLAAATLVVYGWTFGLMQWLLGALARTDGGYAAFNLGSHLIALLVMFPPAFCAGMTLPLITHALLRRGAGERAIGAVYAANTVGAIGGVFAAVHFGLPWLGLKGLVALGASIDIGLGLVLLWRTAAGSLAPRLATAIGALAVAGTLAWVQLDLHKMASGVYRHGELLERDKAQILYHRDGRTATVSLLRKPSSVSILTNGKSDATLNPDPSGPVHPDEITMLLTAALPLAIHPQARSAANIGFGSGLTSAALLASDRLAEVDTIEIEAAIVEAARGFSPRNDAVYGDPRSRIHIEDAKRFFSTSRKRYDIIISEPSNPWVSGVASLFTDEFYGRVKRHLNEGGVFAQWIQLYEIEPALVASVFKALGRNFSDYAVYAPYDFDLVVVARSGGPLPPLSAELFAQPRLARELARIQVRSAADLQLHRIGVKRALQPFFDGFPIPVNSDFFPVLDQNAARARFRRESAAGIVGLATAPVPALEVLGDSPAQGRISALPRPWLGKAELTRQAFAARDYLVDGAPGDLAQVSEAWRDRIELVRLLAIECLDPRRSASVEHLASIADALVPFLPAAELRPVWERLRAAPCASRLGERPRAWVALLAAVAERDPGEMARLGEALLERGDANGEAGADYLRAAALVGRLARGERDQALALWRRAEGRIGAGYGMLRDLLRGHLLALEPGVPGPGPDGARPVSRGER